MSRCVTRFVGSILVLALALSISMPALGGTAETVRPTEERAPEIRVLVDENRHVVFDAQIGGAGEVIRYSYRLNPKTGQGVLQFVALQNGRVVYTSAPQTVLDQTSSLDADAFVDEFLACFQQLDQSELLGRIVDSRGTPDAVVAALAGEATLSIVWTAANLAALSAFLVANWPAIVIAGCLFASAYLMYEWFRDNFFNLPIPYGLTTSALNHVAQPVISKTIKLNNGPIEIYYGPSNDKVLLVFRIPDGTYGDVSSNLANPGVYDKINFNLTGYYLLVLYNPHSRAVFHANIRYLTYMGQDVEYFRVKEKLTVRFFPFPITVDNAYLTKPLPPSCPTDQTAK